MHLNCQVQTERLMRTSSTVTFCLKPKLSDTLPVALLKANLVLFRESPTFFCLQKPVGQILKEQIST